MSDYLVDTLVELAGEVAELRRRQSQMHRRGRIDGIRNGGNEVRIKFGEDEDGNPIRSPWIPVTGSNGAVKTRPRYSEGEHVFVDNIDGDWENAEIRPSNHHNEGQSPTQDPNETVIHDEGGARLSFKNGAFIFKVGGVTHTIDQSGITTTGGSIKHDGKNIGSTHVHGGVDPGGGNTAGPEA